VYRIRFETTETNTSVSKQTEKTKKYKTEINSSIYCTAKSSLKRSALNWKLTLYSRKWILNCVHWYISSKHVATFILIWFYLIFMTLSCCHDSNVVLSWRCHFFVCIVYRQHGRVWNDKMMTLCDVVVILWEVIMMKWWYYQDAMLKLSWWHDNFVMMAW
jgi:hypothetical protein